MDVEIFVSADDHPTAGAAQGQRTRSDPSTNPREAKDVSGSKERPKNPAIVNVNIRSTAGTGAGAGVATAGGVRRPGGAGVLISKAVLPTPTQVLTPSICVFAVLFVHYLTHLLQAPTPEDTTGTHIKMSLKSIKRLDTGTLLKLQENKCEGCKTVRLSAIYSFEFHFALCAALVERCSWRRFWFARH